MSEIRANTISDAAGTGPVTLTGQSAAKAWVNFNGEGTVATRNSLNVSSLTDVGTGKYNVSFSNAFSAADYAASIGGVKDNTTDNGNFSATAGATSRLPATGFCPLTCVYGNTATLQDFPYVYLGIHGDFA